MNITFYAIDCDPRVVDKSTHYVTVDPNNLFVSYSMEGIMKTPLDVLNPTINIDISSFNSRLRFYLMRVNYAFIEELDRYYFIVSKIFVNDSIIQYQLSVDVLMSYKDHIKALTCFIERNENSYNGLIEDDKRDFRNDNRVLEYVPTDISGLTLTKFKLSLNDTYPHNIAMTALDFHEYPSTFWSSIRSYLPSYEKPKNPYTPLSSINIDQFSLQNTTKVYVFEDADQMLKTLYTLQMAYSTRFSFIKSIMAFPFSLDCYYRPATISGANIDKFGLYLGNEGRDASNPIKYHEGTGSTDDIFLDLSRYLYGEEIKIAQFKFDSFKSFMDFKPYTHIEIYCPYYGWVEIDPNKVSNEEQVSVSYIVNYENGSAQLMVNRHVIAQGIVECLFSAECQLGVRIPLDKTNFEENQRQREAIYLSATLQAVAGALQVGAGLATSNPLLIASGTLSGVGSIGKATVQANQIFDKANVQFASGVMGLYGYQEVRVRITKSVPVIDDSNIAGFASKFGLPLRETRILSTLTGMTVCSNVILSGFQTATDKERNEITQLLQSGIIL